MTQTLEPTNGGAIVQRSFQPMSPIGNAGALAGLLKANRNSIAQALPRHITPERLIKTLLVAANRTPKILDCTQSSILETINRAAELGLDLSGTLGEAYPVPYGNTLQLIIGYRGLAKLAWQSGEIEYIEAEVVYSNDKFVYRKGMNGALEFEPLLTGDRGEPVGAYALVKMKSGGTPRDFMTVAQIEAVRLKAQSKNSPAWKDHWDEMAKKTVFRRVAKWLPLSTEKFVAAIEQDDADFGMVDVLHAETVNGAAALADKLRARRLPEPQQPAPVTNADDQPAPADPLRPPRGEVSG